MVVNKFLNLFGIETVDEEIDENEREKVENAKEIPMPVSNKKNMNKIVSIHSSSKYKMVVMQPQKIEDAKDVADHLKSNESVIINLEHIALEEAKRILNFLYGSIYALEGTVQKVSYGIYVLVPNSVDLQDHLGDGLKDELSKKGVYV
jgi:cell division inhibitor SepF